MADNIYIDLNQCAKVNIKDVYFKDVATITCSDKNLLNKIKTTKIFIFHDTKQTRYILSALKLVEIINTNFPGNTVNLFGSDKLLLEYEPYKKTNKFGEFTKTAFVFMTLFIGAGFAIMSFNRETNIESLLAYIYEIITGKTSTNFTFLEIGYSLGIFIGITLFYNHLGKKRITKDPTPVEIEIRKYETDVNSTLIDGIKRKDARIDVD